MSAVTLVKLTDPARGYKLAIERIAPLAEDTWVRYKSSEIRIHEADAWLGAGLRFRGRDILDFLASFGAEFAGKLGVEKERAELVQFHDHSTREYVLFMSARLSRQEDDTVRGTQQRGTLPEPGVIDI